MSHTSHLTPEQTAVLRMVQDSLPDSPAPFRDIALACHLEESQVLELLRGLKQEGVIRRFGATLRHQEAGYECNVMVAWQVEPEQDIEEVARRRSERPEITHVYERRSCREWPFNLYTMVHGSSEKDCLNVVASLSRETGVERHELLFSERPPCATFKTRNWIGHNPAAGVLHKPRPRSRRWDHA